MLISPAVIRRLKFYNRLFLAYIGKYRLRIVISLLIIVLILIGTFRIWPVISKSSTISIGYVGSYTIENVPTEILSLVTQSLITVDSKGRPVPSLASHWTVSDDGKTYIVFLKDSLLWHDATLVETSNISLAITDVEVTSLNNKAIQFKLPNPISSFPQALNRPIFKAKSFYGTGEYRIVKIDQVEEVVKRIFLHPKNSNLPRVEIKFYQNEVQAKNALKIGEVDIVSITNAQDFKRWPNLKVKQSTDFSQAVTIFFNNQDPLLSSKELRQALIYAIDRSSFDGEIAHSPISSPNWAYNENVNKYNYNESKAKELLSKVDNQQKLKITLNVAPGLEEIAESIKSDWQTLGIEVNLKIIEENSNNFQAFLAINKIMPDPDQYALWHSTQKKSNITSYQNVKVDKLLEDARATHDEKTRRELYLNFQQTIVEDAPAAFLYYPFKYKVVYNNAKNLLEKLPKDSNVF